MKPTTNILDNLKSIDLGRLKSFYEEPVEVVRNVQSGLDSDRVHIRKVERRKMLNELATSNLASTLTTIPPRGESWHVAAKGNWAGWLLVPRFIELSQPGRIEHLSIATLGFSRDNADHLLTLLDAGRIGTVDFLYSCYFRSNEKELTSYLSAELVRRGHRCAAARQHAKIIAIKTATADIVVESSANLRSSRNIECFTFSNDRQLLEFHVGWIRDVLQKAGTP